MNIQPNSDNPNSLGITGDAKPNVPTYACLVYIRKNEDATLTGRVANLAGIEISGGAERDLLSKIMQAFKARLSELSEQGQEVPWIDPPQPPLENEQVRSIPMHL